jgi:hypothetical protein
MASLRRPRRWLLRERRTANDVSELLASGPGLGWMCDEVEVMPVDEHEGELEAERVAMRGEISVRQSELDDIAELVGVRKDAPYGAVRDRVAELARAGAQLKLTGG